MFPVKFGFYFQHISFFCFLFCRKWTWEFVQIFTLFSYGKSESLKWPSNASSLILFHQFNFFSCFGCLFFRYEEAIASGKANYDREVEQVLERHIVECDRKIQRSLRRLEDERSEAATAIAVSEVTKVGTV